MKNVQCFPVGAAFSNAAGRRTPGRGFVYVTVEVFDNLTGRVEAALNPTDPKSLWVPSRAACKEGSVSAL